MVDYKRMPFGYSLDFNITDQCNIRCEHCYMKKRDKMLSPLEMKEMLHKIPLTLKRLVISGGEPFLNIETLYEAILYARSIFSPSLRIRISTNGKYIYDTDDHIRDELKRLYDYGVTEILLSVDKYHLDAGIKKERLLRISEIANELSLGLKVRFLDIGKGVPIGEFTEDAEEKISKRSCLNRPENIFSPYLFANTDGSVYLCSFRLTKSVGNLISEDWDTIAKNIELQYEYLSGNIVSNIVRSEKDSTKSYDIYKKYGECYLCEKHEKVSKESSLLYQ